MGNSSKGRDSKQGVGNLPASGTYVLEVVNRDAQRLRIGRFGDLGLAPGVYLYVGSARRHLPHRIARHLRQDKPSHWHIDYVTNCARVARVVAWDHDRAGECEVAKAVRDLPGARVVMRGLGSSDCRCETHFVRLEGKSDWVAGLSERFGPSVADVQWQQGGEQERVVRADG